MLYRTDADWVIDRLRQVPRLTLGVVGDLILDEYLFGDVRRISPEAPVPIVEIQDRTIRPGGAANVALNLKALGAEVYLFGVIGDDPAGYELKAALREENIHLEGLLTDPSRPTTVKTRVVSQNQQMIRLDKEDPSPLSSPITHQLLEALTHAEVDLDALIIQDYNKGTLTPPLIEGILRQKGRWFLAVDPKKENFFRYQGVHLLKPNLREAREALGAVGETASVTKLADVIMEQLAPEVLVITLGKEGMALYTPEDAYHIPARSVEVYDVTGAGDTAIAFLVLGFLIGLPPESAGLLASLAAGIEIQKFGAAQVSLEELIPVIQEEWQDLAQKIRIHHKQGGRNR